MTTQRLLPVLAASLALVLTGCVTDDSTDGTLSAVSPHRSSWVERSVSQLSPPSGMPTTGAMADSVS
ncbi:hypothetical protein R3O64_03775 [Corynebacterium hesseae]|uniref:hypothetical protein n=1 Tax=Corynebacterium hesseae TaxID=2913502 RepID=UPI0030D3DD00